MLYSVKNVLINVSSEAAYTFIANAKNLPLWTNAFTEVGIDGTALMETPAGEVAIMLDTRVNEQTGCVDWFMSFPDGSQGKAFSRVIALDDKQTLYSFTLTPPPVPLEALEGALQAQASILEKELIALKQLLESSSEPSDSGNEEQTARSAIA